jgi:hypothetical protein
MTTIPSDQPPVIQLVPLSSELRGIAISLAEVAIAALAATGSHGAQNMLTFLVIANCLLLVFAVMLLLSPPPPRKARRWRCNVSTACDLVVLGILAWCGWLWLASGYFVCFIVSLLLRERYQHPCATASSVQSVS